MDVADRRETGGGVRAGVIIGAAVVGGIAMGAFFRGPCYGVALGAIVGAVLGLGAWLVVRRLGPSRFRRWACTAVAILAAAIAYAVLRPPSARTMLRRYVGLQDLKGISELQEFHVYGRDPAFGLKLQLTEEGLQNIVTHMGVNEDLEPRPRHLDRFYGFSVPDWWCPDEINSSRTWTQVDPDVVPWLTLRYEATSGVAYLVVSWH